MMLAIAISAAVLATLLGAAMTLIGLPGTWLILASALILEFAMPEALTWRPIAAMAVLAVAGELIELFASALGASKAGGSKRAGIGSILGSIAGAIIATIAMPFLPIIATILGAIAGAGLGAIALQLTKMDEPSTRREHYGHARRVGVGAARARLISTIVKSLIAVVMGAVLIGACAIV